MAVVISAIDGDIAWSSILRDILVRVERDEMGAVTEDEWAHLRDHWRSRVLRPGDEWSPASRTYARLYNRFGPMWLPTLEAS